MRLTRRRFVGTVAASGALAACGGLRENSSAGRPKLAARRVARVVSPQRDLVGEVFAVRRTIPAADTPQVDPFILLDFFDFRIERGQLGGLAPHPHRGIETVTVLLDGAIEHGDSLGNRGLLEAGGVQWMTAAAGIVHEENPADILREKGGRVLGLQLWVNLPASVKLAPPHYQDRIAKQIPELSEAGVRARVIAGELHDAKAAIATETPLSLLDYALPKGAEVTLAYPGHWSAFLHVVSGMIDIGTTRVGEAQMAVLATAAQRGGGAIAFRNSGAGTAHVILGGGEPIAEPLARYGPFAMNTQSELMQAMDDYRAGRMGAVANPTYERIRLR